jgi:hypothetical protein
MITTGTVCFYCCEPFVENDFYMTVGEQNNITCIGCTAAKELLGA